MHDIFGLIFLAALIVLLMQLPRKAVVAVLGVCALIWLLTPGPMFGPMHFGRMHWMPPHFGLPPHLMGIVFVLMIFVGLAWLAFKRNDKAEEDKKSS